MAASGRVFLLGASGWLGQAIQQLLPGSVPVQWLEDMRAVVLAADDLIINAAGSKDPETMAVANTELVAQLIELAKPAGVPIVHLGSAAEYGTSLESPLTEDVQEQPESEYGRTKLAGTRLLQQYGNACVLRVFNIVATPPQAGSPLAEILAKARHAANERHSPELWAAETRRDWVSKGFVVDSVVSAVSSRSTGLFNVCSGIPVSMGNLTQALLGRWGVEIPVLDLNRVAANTVVGDPTRWRVHSGLSEQLTAEAIAEMLIPDEEATK